MKTLCGCSRRRASGLTLIEVLATVFVLGMGLIMVAAAFPVGLDQTRRTKEDTQASQLARSAVQMVRAGDYALAVSDLAALKTAGGYVVNAAEDWRVGATQRWAYVEGWKDSTLWPARSGDLLAFPVLSRTDDAPGSPLLRLTVVVVKISAQQLKDRSNVVLPYPYELKTVDVASTTSFRRRGNDNFNNSIIGDYVVGPNGLGYRITGLTVSGTTVTDLTVDSAHGLTGAVPVYIFYNAVAVYHTFVSG